MLTAVDHVILAVADPDAAAAELEASLGLAVVGGGRHAAHGTYNRLLWLGDSYLELMGIFDPALAAESWWGRHMAQVLAGKPAGYAGFALASSDLAADVERLRAIGAQVSDPIDGQRARADGEVVRWRIARLPPPDPELGLTFLIEHDLSAAEWRPADRATRAAFEHPLGGPARLIRLELPVADVARASLRLLRELGLQFRPSLAGQGARDTSIGEQVLRLLPARPGSSPAIVLRAGSAATSAELLGVRLELVPG
jgi:catechol 2,3-dioxygenase-like lactoylglutathione lyase family enzyme